MSRYDWMEDAACRDADPEIFFPEGTTTRAYHKTIEAKDHCAVCPVLDQCYEFAASNDYVIYGIWAGLDASKIRRITSGRPGARRSA